MSKHFPNTNVTNKYFSYWPAQLPVATCHIMSLLPLYALCQQWTNGNGQPGIFTLLLKQWKGVSVVSMAAVLVACKACRWATCFLLQITTGSVHTFKHHRQLRWCNSVVVVVRNASAIIGGRSDMALNTLQILRYIHSLYICSSTYVYVGAYIMTYIYLCMLIL